MQVTRYIERHGFRRWYERQLIESHAYLALGFVALILLLSGLELLSDAEAGIRYISRLDCCRSRRNAVSGGMAPLRSTAGACRALRRSSYLSAVQSVGQIQSIGAGIVER